MQAGPVRVHEIELPVGLLERDPLPVGRPRLMEERPSPRRQTAQPQPVRVHHEDRAGAVGVDAHLRAEERDLRAVGGVDRDAVAPLGQPDEPAAVGGSHLIDPVSRRSPVHPALHGDLGSVGGYVAASEVQTGVGQPVERR